MWLNSCAFLITAWLLSACEGQINLTSCGREEKFLSYMDMAMEMLIKAKDNSGSCKFSDLRSARAIDCEDLQKLGHKRSGVYTIWLENRVLDGAYLDVYCDMDTDGGGWTVIQRRGNFSLPTDYFFREWFSYKVGFGDKNKEFWLGNDNIFALTNQRLYSVRFDFRDMTGETRYALYDRFWIDDEDHLYTLHIKDYTGTAGDSMTLVHNNRKFSTKDKDNDGHKGNCAQVYKGAWWYGECHHSNLNGLNLLGKHDSPADGVNWKTWKGHNESMISTEIKIRSKRFNKTIATHVKGDSRLTRSSDVRLSDARLTKSSDANVSDVRLTKSSDAGPTRPSDARLTKPADFSESRIN